jgi:transcriptional regulator with XRE-family HTH domain
MVTEEERLHEAGRRLRRTRKNMTLTQADVAQACGVAVSTVGAWESGRHEPNPRSLRLLSELYGQAAAYLRASDLEEGMNGSGGADPERFDP